VELSEEEISEVQLRNIKTRALPALCETTDHTMGLFSCRFTRNSTDKD